MTRGTVDWMKVRTVNEKMVVLIQGNPSRLYVLSKLEERQDFLWFVLPYQRFHKSIEWPRSCAAGLGGRPVLSVVVLEPRKWFEVFLSVGDTEFCFLCSFLVSGG